MLSSSLLTHRPREGGGDEKQVNSPDGEWDGFIGEAALHFQRQIKIRFKKSSLAEGVEI